MVLKFYLPLPKGSFLITKKDEKIWKSFRKGENAISIPCKFPQITSTGTTQGKLQLEAEKHPSNSKPGVLNLEVVEHHEHHDLISAFKYWDTLFLCLKVDKTRRKKWASSFRRI